MPGLIEAHSHPVMLATRHRRFVDVRETECKTAEDVLGKIRAKVGSAESSEDPATRWCIIVGWDPELMPSLPILDFSYMNGISNKFHVKSLRATTLPGSIKELLMKLGLIRIHQILLAVDPALVLLLAAAPQPSCDDIT